MLVYVLVYFLVDRAGWMYNILVCIMEECKTVDGVNMFLGEKLVKRASLLSKFAVQFIYWGCVKYCSHVATDGLLCAWLYETK